MCGIAGFFGKRTIARPTVEAMLAQIKRRGPDAQHVVAWSNAWIPTQGPAPNALLHARLSIIDPRPEADQPMSNDAGDVWICYNGEVYGWEQDRVALEREGYTFRTRSDTEFILRAYEAWGFEALLPKLRGMFALVIVDLRHRLVWAARDRMGLKPLVYYSHEGEFGFGSTVRSVLPYVPAARRGFDADSIDAYLAHRYVPAPRTILKHVQRLENGHYLRFELNTGRLDKRCYWRPQPDSGDWRATLDDAIRLRTVADRPVGLFLSSGIDSSALACRLSQLGYRHLQSFTAAFPGSHFDEGASAKRIAARLELPNQQVLIPSSIADEFARIVADLDEPFADPSCFPTWYLARAAVEQVKVVLGGDGGDELFAGYKRVAKHLRTHWRAHLRLPLPILASADSKGAAKWLSELRMSWPQAYSLRFSGFTPNQRRFLQPARRLTQPCYWRSPELDTHDPMLQLLAIDYANYLPEYILRKGDLCTMAHGLELRAPLLDHRLYQTILNLPANERFTTPPKQVLAPLLAPLAELDPFRAKKRGFNPPLAHWLRDDLADRLLGVSERLAASTNGQLDAARVDTVIQRYRGGQESLAEQVLQLIILAESTAQLRGLMRTV